MLGIIIALLSAVLVGIAMIVIRKSYKELHPSVAYLWDSLFGVLIWIPMGIIFGGNIEEAIQCIGYAIISAILSEALVFYAFSKGNLSITSILVATYPVYTIIFSFVINNELLTTWQLFAAVITILGTLFVCMEKQKEKVKKIIAISSVIIPLITAISIGLSDTLTKGIINETSSFSFLIAIGIVQVPISIIYFKLSKQKFRETFKDLKENKKNYKYAIWGGLLNIIGTALLLISFNYTLASIASPITRRI
jgi:drug/metabolite transporter (DMT)-like permease